LLLVLGAAFGFLDRSLFLGVEQRTGAAAGGDARRRGDAAATNAHLARLLLFPDAAAAGEAVAPTPAESPRRRLRLLLTISRQRNIICDERQKFSRECTGINRKWINLK
jgi:hypothetical protein